ncbi:MULTISPECIES: amidohydrolase family protein [Staphylococcus]|uniref:amidohydrolase family protein n=1 Tax=Staphylococcus TaxID=1279 RepID=UPI00188088E4|nr:MULTISPECIES: amidohydrolase family protein [unclassified Staphylococcus]MBF2756471.1 amidohydrolase [Staphylococcus haemolyticus]MBF2773719.1 amidohydrolase [Staphylococcus haemolyticus]MBF2775835.1 amidohydrolase [Staphylococcus haemolyticus]MBF2815404.1 amidohydrolase [Staphylococcus haemolyticus]MBF9719822.1 amidohydrolase [Staphylococcus haemolyticus]
MNKRQEIIDIHHHIIPNVYRDALRKIGVTTAGGFPIRKWEPEDSIQMMDELNIDVGYTSISEPATIPFNRKKAAKVARQVNEYQAQLKKKYPDRFKSFALVPMPHVKETIKEIEYALDVLKLDGVGLFSNYGNAYLGNDVFEKVMVVLNEHHAKVFIHPSANAEDFQPPQYVVADFIQEFTFNTTRAATNLIFSGTVERYPNIKFILAHAGGTLPYIQWRINNTLETQKYIIQDPKNRLKSLMNNGKSEIIKEVAKHPIQYAKMFKFYRHGLQPSKTITKTAADYMSHFYYDTGLSTGESTFASLKAATDTEHILFGSDAHYAPNQWIAKMEQDIDNTGAFSDIEKANIFSHNTTKLFK